MIKFICIEKPADVHWFTIGKVYDVQFRIGSTYYIKADDGICSMISNINSEYGYSLMVTRIKFRRV